MIVNWKRKGPNYVPLMKGNLQVGNIQLLPGMNYIPDEKWEVARVNLKVDYMWKDIEECSEIKEKEIVTEKKVKNATGKTEIQKEKKKVKKSLEFSEMKDSDCLKIVLDCYNVHTLEFWKVNEHRKEIKAAIANQLEEIENGKKKKK